MIRSAIRRVLEKVGSALEQTLRSLLRRDDDYTSVGKPICDWDDKAAREALINALVIDAYALLLCLNDQELSAEQQEAATLLATVVGQDVEYRADGRFHIAQRVAPDRIISTVDPEARHGHKTAAHSFDGYKGHVSIDPDSEIIVHAEVTPGNCGDAKVAEKLLSDVLSATPEENATAGIEVYGDASYGTADTVEKLEAAGIAANVKVQAPAAKKGVYSKAAFAIDLENKTVRCPAGHVVPIAYNPDGSGLAAFGMLCDACPYRGRCTNSPSGRTVSIHAKEGILQKARTEQKEPEWKAKYRAIRPRVERKIGHLMFRKHGGRRARVRGTIRVGHDFRLLVAGINLKRLAVLGVCLYK
jgi:hypothetical protein